MRRYLGWLLLAFGFAAQGQYSIDWYKVSGGGGTSAGGQFSLSGTIGQADAGGPMTSGPYTLTGGFWVLPEVVQTPGAPVLSIMPAAPGYVTISWLPATPGFGLQESSSLTPAAWTNSASGPANPITLPAKAAAKFYRLRGN